MVNQRISHITKILIIPIRTWIKSGNNYNLSYMRNPSDFHILEHLYKYRGVYIQRQSYCLTFFAILVWLSPFELVSHSEFWTWTVFHIRRWRAYLQQDLNKGFKSLLETVLKECVQLLFWVRTVYELVSYSELWTMTVAPIKGSWYYL